jgi:hypothetical protein
VALGLDQGGNGDAWGFDLAAERVTLAAAGLPWPHYFVDLGGVGGSADPAGNLVVIAACKQLAPPAQASPGPSGPAPPDASPATPATSTASPPSSPSSPSSSSSAGTSASPAGCLHPELIALSL